MEDLTQAQAAELNGEMWTVIQNCKLVGIHAVLIVSGRGVSKVCYSADSAHYVPTMLATAFRDVRAKNATEAN